MSKKILITGANSYIGTSFENWLAKYPDEYEVDTVDMIDGSWREKSFAGYDAVFHVAGIAHADTGKVSDERKAEYYRINCDLAVETAKKAKADGVRQFIFMSSIIVYGSKNTVITKDTKPNPDNYYGDSKLQADIKLTELKDDLLRITIIRPPMVYGKGSKGNFPRLVALAKKTPIFPDYANKRSMIYIDNLCEFIKCTIDNGKAGVLMPQNKRYVNTTQIVRTIAGVSNKKIKTTKLFNPIITLIKKSISTINKIFGDLIYEQTGDEEKYNVVEFEESIKRSI